MERRTKNGEKEWRCDMCNQWFEVDEEWDKKGAKEECKELWGIEPDDNSPAVCDDCWEKIHPLKHVDLYKQAKEIYRLRDLCDKHNINYKEEENGKN